MLSRIPLLILLKLFCILTNMICWALSSPVHIGVVGGGSSGIFAALRITDMLQHDDSLHPNSIVVTVHESANNVLRSIRNNDQNGILFDTAKKPMDILSTGYPRGRKEIISLLTKYFPPIKQQKWFEDQGVEFTTNPDGTMVNRGEDTAFIFDDVVHNRINESIKTKSKVSSISRDNKTGKFHLTANGKTEIYDCVILATGNSHLGHQLAKSLGHTIARPVRSSFGFILRETTMLSYLENGCTYYLPYVRLSYRVTIKGQKRPRTIKSEGPAELQVNNNGVITLNGMATFALSSLAAFELQDVMYKGTLIVHFCPDNLEGKVENIEQQLWEFRQSNSNVRIGVQCPLSYQYVDFDEYDWETESFKTVSSECIPVEIWQGLINECSITCDSTWGKVSPKKCRKLAETIVGCSIEFSDRYKVGPYPFINAGGILLHEIDMSTMQSNATDGLYCCGQVLDGDGCHISFSLMKSFATGNLAGENAFLFAKQHINVIEDCQLKSQ